jgi:sensor histidine kinase YesM
VKHRWLEIVLNGLFWALTAGLIVSAFSIQAREIELVNGVETIRTVRNETLISALSVVVVIAGLLFYANFWNIRRLAKGVKAMHVVLASILMLAVALCAYYLLEKPIFPQSQLSLPMSLTLGILFFYFTISISYGLGKVWVVTARRSQQLVLDKKQSELTLLRNQLQPHFIFNALNNLLSLVDQEKSPLVANSIDRLSGLLRYVVYETTADKVTVHREITFIRNYAELQLLRFDKDELNFVLNVNGDYLDQPIEPGICIAFVENAFKYGAEPEEPSEIQIDVDVTEAHRIIFDIRNPVRQVMQTNAGSGTGIATTRDRLKLVYPDKHDLHISDGEIFHVQLTLFTA